MVQRRNYVKEPWGTPDLHGTAVEGIIGSNDQSFTGMAPEATLYNYKVLATTRDLNGDDFHGALAIQQALEDGAHIANCSWGAGLATDGTGREARACDRAWQLGLTIVKSAGNRGPGSNTLTAPADADGIIVVAATDKKATITPSYSSRGPLQSGKTGILIAAPGGSLEDGSFSCQTNGGFGSCGFGTSYAAPHISGLLALLLEGDLDLSPDELRNLVEKIGIQIPDFEANDQGLGVVSMLSSAALPHS